MDVLGYIRVSTEDQAGAGHSLALVQPERLRAWCALMGHRLVDIVIDGEGEGDAFRGVSGGLPLAKRKGGAELLRRLANGEAQGVLVADIERLFRDVDDGRHFLLRHWKRAGTQLFCIGETFDLTTAAGRLQLTIRLAVAEFERERTGERTAHVAQALRQSGRVYGTVPYGCVAVDGFLYRAPAQWPIREQIVAMRTVDGFSLQHISDRLRGQRITAPGGGMRWPKSTIATLVETHDALTHLPFAGKGSTHPAAAPEAPVSPETAADARVH